MGLAQRGVRMVHFFMMANLGEKASLDDGLDEILRAVKITVKATNNKGLSKDVLTENQETI